MIGCQEEYLTPRLDLNQEYLRLAKEDHYVLLRRNEQNKGTKKGTFEVL